MRHSLLLALAAATITACGRDTKTAAVPTNDSALARDLTLAGRLDTVAPQLQDVPEPKATPAPSEPVRRAERPATKAPVPRREPPRQVARTPEPEPVAQAPAPTPAATVPASAPARRTGTIASGTSFDLVADSRVCTGTARPGDKLVARLASAVTGTNGAVFPAGSQAVIEVAQVSTEDENPRIAFRVKSIIVGSETYPASGDVVPTGAVERQRVEGGVSDKKKVIGGAVAGAILGQILGHSTKGTVIGAAAGAAAGTVAAKAGAKYEACLPAGAPLRATLSQNVDVVLQ